MNTQFNSGENFTELVFENKNKAYGAYAIRKSYSDNVSISLLITSAFFGIIALVAVVLTKNDMVLPDLENIVPDIFVTSTLVEIPKPELPKLPEQKKVAPPKSDSGHMTASDDKKDVVDKTNDQTVISKNPNPDADSTTHDGPDVKVPAYVAPVETKNAIKYAQVMPAMDNMAQFIADNLKFPRVAVSNGTTGTVVVTFVVELDGSISDIKLMNEIGDGCGEEALRVVNKMPKWKPGMNDGKPVRVQCNLPIRFRLK